jgi:hypothetical protein
MVQFDVKQHVIIHYHTGASLRIALIVVQQLLTISYLRDSMCAAVLTNAICYQSA